MYLKSIRLRNIKCFADATIDFTDGENVRLWTTFFGRNGLGKSTLLQAIGAALAGPSAVRELLPAADGWARKGADWGEIVAEILWSQGDSVTTRPRATPFSLRYLVSGSDPAKLPELLEERPTLPEVVAWSGEGSPKDRENYTKDRKQLQQAAFAEDNQGWLACGYGPFRRLSGGAEYANQIVSRQRRSARFVTLFREDAALTNATAWLLDLYNAAKDNSVADAKKLEIVKKALSENLMPEPAELILTSRTAKLKRGEGSEVLFQDLSDGYRSMLALGIDLLRWLTQAFPEQPDPLSCAGVVIIDELDSHLHPEWQRKIGHWLREKFPRLQFIIATHSPFLAQVAGAPTEQNLSDPDQISGLSDHEDGNIKLSPSDHGVIFVPSKERVSLLQADQILQSELFALESLYSPKVEERLAQFRELRRKLRNGDLSDAEKGQLEQLDLWASQLPFGATEGEREAEVIVQREVQKNKDKILELE
jgi:hypothetical protein